MLPSHSEYNYCKQEAKEPDAADDGYLSTSRAAVLADAEALLTCYGVGEESGAELLHAVVELCFTSSVRFLQPGLLLKVSHTPCSPPPYPLPGLVFIPHLFSVLLATWSPAQGKPYSFLTPSLSSSSFSGFPSPLQCASCNLAFCSR